MAAQLLNGVIMSKYHEHHSVTVRSLSKESLLFNKAAYDRVGHKGKVRDRVREITLGYISIIVDLSVNV